MWDRDPDAEIFDGSFGSAVVQSVCHGLRYPSLWRLRRWNHRDVLSHLTLLAAGGLRLGLAEDDGHGWLDLSAVPLRTARQCDSSVLEERILRHLLALSSACAPLASRAAASSATLAAAPAASAWSQA